MSSFARLHRRAPPRLPDDVMLSIFNLCDAQTIFNFSLVSKHFHQLVLYIERISIEIPYTIEARDSRDPLWPEGLLDFLSQFSQLKYLNIKFLSYGPFPQRSEQIPGSALRWKVDSHGLFYLFIEECDRDDGDWNLCNVLARDVFDRDAEILEEFDVSYNLIFANTAADIQLWTYYIEALVDILLDINEVRATDSRGQGRMVVEGGRLEYLRRRDDHTMLEHALIRRKFWVAPIVKLPLSHDVMYEVFLHLSRTGEDSDDSVMENFCDEEEYYKVAARIIIEAASIEEVEWQRKYVSMWENILWEKSDMHS